MPQTASSHSGADAVDVLGAFGDADGAARVEEVEDVGALQGEVEGGVDEGGGTGALWGAGGG